MAHPPGWMLDPVLRKLARDHWVRLHGTPRVTVLVGDERGREIWEQWIAVTNTPGTLLEGDFGERIREAVARALGEPAHPIAVLVAAEAASRWRDGRRDRLAAMVDEGWTVVSELQESPGPLEPPGPAAPPADTRSAGTRGARASRDRAGRAGAAKVRVLLDARSAAEATLYEALEATAATAGRFALNESLSVRFGPQAAEIDLLSRGDRIAIEIDGIHHFADPDCYRRDRRKDLLLQTQGFVVVRLLAEDVMRDVRSSVNAVCQALAYRLKERAR
jgi:very-short-patch-repair endonuclease